MTVMITQHSIWIRVLCRDGKQLLKAIHVLLQYDVLLMMKADFFSCFQQGCQGPLKEVQTVVAPLRSAEYQGENLLQVCGCQAESSHAWKDFELRVTHTMSQQIYLSLIDRVREIPNCTQD